MDIYTGFYPQVLPLSVAQLHEAYFVLLGIPVSKYANAFSYLHGNCADFAAMLSHIYGYSIVTIRHYEKDGDVQGQLIHAFCVSDVYGIEVMIDIRGMTTDAEAFFSEFAYECIYDPQTEELWDSDGPVLEENWEGNDTLFDGDYVGWVDEDIRKFILAYDNIYNVASLERAILNKQF